MLEACGCATNVDILQPASLLTEYMSAEKHLRNMCCNVNFALPQNFSITSGKPQENSECLCSKPPKYLYQQRCADRRLKWAKEGSAVKLFLAIYAVCVSLRNKSYFFGIMFNGQLWRKCHSKKLEMSLKWAELSACWMIVQEFKLSWQSGDAVWIWKKKRKNNQQIMLIGLDCCRFLIRNNQLHECVEWKRADLVAFLQDRILDLF